MDDSTALATRTPLHPLPEGEIIPPPKKRKIVFAPATKKLFEKHRYKGIPGGRGGGRSWTIARIFLLWATERPIRVLCAREIQNSIKESVHKLLSLQIELMGFSHQFTVTDTSIRCHVTGAEFIFAGLKTNITKIKSMEGIDYAWVEEAETVSEESWQVLIPTIRKEGSEIWASFNPREKDDPTSQRFIENPPPDCVTVWLSHQQNPWFPDVLKRDMEYAYRVDPETAAHVWGGQYRKRSKGQIFAGKYIVAEMTPDRGPHSEWDGPYHGADWGFSNDPTAAVRVWLAPGNFGGRKLYIEYEAWGIGVETEDIGDLFTENIPGIENHVVRADSSRPETISFVRRNGGIPVEAAKKWEGSVEDGVAFLLNFEQIIIHPRCIHMQDEARFYSYKIDRLTGDVLRDILDKWNHLWDAIRYALQPMIGGTGGTNSGLYSGYDEDEEDDED